VIQDDHSEYEHPDDELVYRSEEVQLLDSEGEDTVSLDEMRDMEFRDNGYKWEDWN
jgi:hypothetical protein